MLNQKTNTVEAAKLNEQAAHVDNLHCTHCNTSKAAAFVFTEWGACLDCIDQHRE